MPSSAYLSKSAFITSRAASPYFPKISRGKVYLSPIHTDDYELFTKWMNDKRITDWITTWPQIISITSEKEWLENVAKSWEYNLAIIRKDGDKLLWTVWLFHIDHINQSAELWISIGDFDEHSKWYGADAINAMLSFSYDTLNLYNVFLQVKSFNKKAIACYKKVWFQEIWTRHHCQYCNGEWHDLVIMEMLKPDWQEKNK